MSTSGHGTMPREEHINDALLRYLEIRQADGSVDRDRFLADYPDLRAELESFLADYDDMECLTAPLRRAAQDSAAASVFAPCSDAGSRLVFDVGAQPRPAARNSEIGQLGDFRLLREVGRGGMGVVYEAEQLSLQRRVALKVLPFAAAIDPRQLQRFKNEAMAAAHLRHEHIVPVFAVGCERGVHYYAMQFVDGQSLAALIEELRRRETGSAAAPPSQPSRNGAADATEAATLGDTADWRAPSGGLVAELAATTLSRVRALGRRRYFEWVAGIGRQAALALEYAHQTGIVHRDVKPANLLLDERGHVWVADFGLAQMTGDGGLTVTGELVGTLRYASPEQVHARRGVTDQRSDVYSLGATLYELLTLRPIFDGRDRNEILQQIGNADPQRPRSCDAAIPIELETIVLKALNKEPDERYANAHDLADDLQCFLDNRPIKARRPTLVERLWKWSRRHPAVVVASAAALLIVSAISLVGMALIRSEQARTMREHQRAEEALRHARHRAQEAEARFELARRSVDELIFVSQEELAHRPRMVDLRRRLLSSALTYYQEFIQQRGDDLHARAELLETTKRVEMILADLAVLRSAGKLHLLCQPAVLDDLGLNDGQRAKIAEVTARIGRQWTEARQEYSRQTPAERSRLTLERARRNDADVNAILTLAQQERLRQVALQLDGPGAFHDPEVIAALRLTPEQRERIRVIQDDAMAEWLRTQRDAKPNAGPMASIGPSPRPIVRTILASLTAEQRTQWANLVGTRFRGRLVPFPSAPGPLLGMNVGK